MYEKLYENKEWLEEQIASGLNARSIANKVNVSYKLINLWLVNFGLIPDTPEVKKP
jgi:transposase